MKQKTFKMMKIFKPLIKALANMIVRNTSMTFSDITSNTNNNTSMPQIDLHVETASREKKTVEYDANENKRVQVVSFAEELETIHANEESKQETRGKKDISLEIFDNEDDEEDLFFFDAMDDLIVVESSAEEEEEEAQLFYDAMSDEENEDDEEDLFFFDAMDDLIVVEFSAEEEEGEEFFESRFEHFCCHVDKLSNEKEDEKGEGTSSMEVKVFVRKTKKRNGPLRRSKRIAQLKKKNNEEPPLQRSARIAALKRTS